MSNAEGSSDHESPGGDDDDAGGDRGRRVLWGYRFTLFGPPGEGGVISFSLGR